MRVTVDSQRCMGHGQCYVHAPEVYEPDAEGFCVVVKHDVEGADLDQALQGAQVCPESAISANKETHV
ncbi:MAG TPA: ferredoxin [Mycobacterium sp.]|nr:ferredoxin [Mycobacterium sp.]